WFKALSDLTVTHVACTIPAKGQRKWRGMMMLPWVIRTAMSTITWFWLFDPDYSAFNWLLVRLGASPVSWLGDPIWARFSVILVNVWYGAPVFMILYLAALKSVPEQLYEAAAVHRPHQFQHLWYQTL